MKKLKLALYTFLVFSFLLGSFPAYGLKKLGQTGLKFLDIGMGARATGMGEAYTAVGGGVNALFYNPAGIAEMDSKFDALFGRTYWTAGIEYDAFGLVVNGGIWGNFGISIISPSYPPSVGTQVADNVQGYIETGEIDSDAFALGITYARTITDLFAVGGTFKFVSQHLGSNLLSDGSTTENEVSGLAYDIGTLYYPGFKSFRFGMNIVNFSAQFKYEETAFQLPLTFKIGVGMDILDFWGEHPDNSFLVDVEAVHPRDYTQRIHIGGEYWYKDMIALRIGYKFNYDRENVTAGLGLNMGGLKLDIAYSEFGDFEPVNRVSLGMLF